MVKGVADFLIASQPLFSPTQKALWRPVNLQSRLSNPNNSTLSEEEKRLLSSWGLPDTVQKQYERSGITSMFQWQVECLSVGQVLEVLIMINFESISNISDLKKIASLSQL